MSTVYYVSDTPSEGDIVVSATTTAATAEAEMSKVHRYRVERVNHSTGRGTVRHSISGKAVQIVRGRFGWTLANGSALSVRFCRETAPVTAPVAAIDATVDHGDKVLCAVRDLDSDQLVGTVETETGTGIWSAPQIYGAQWPTAQQAADALVRDARQREARKTQDQNKARGLTTPDPRPEDRYILQNGVPFGTYPEWPEGPALVAVGEWCTSNITGSGIDGVRVSAFKVLSENPYRTERHPLDGQMYPDTRSANQAKYTAGLIAYMVYRDREYPTCEVVPARRCDLCDEEFVPEPFADPEICPECQDDASEQPHRYGDPCQTCGEPAYDYNVPVCADCRWEAEHNGTDPISRLLTPGKAEVLAKIRRTS
jgi:hypothetical protein